MNAVSNTVANPGGQTVTALFSGVFSDSDSGQTLAGVMVDGNTASGSTGAWQYSTNGGANWNNIGTVGTGSALVLSASTLIRFLRVSGYEGYPTPLSVRAVDSSYSGSFSASGATESRVTADVSAPSGTSPISAVSTDLTAVITGLRNFDAGGNAIDWTDATNWDPNTLPGSGSIVSLSSGAIDMDTSTTTTIYQLLLSGTASLTIHDNSPKTVLDVTTGGSAASGTTLILRDNGFLATDGVFGLQGALSVTSGFGGLSGPGTFINTGSVSVASGSGLIIGSGATFQHGTGATYAGPGSMVFDNGTTLRLAANLTMDAGTTWQFGTDTKGNAASITKSASQTLTNSGSLLVLAATIAPGVTNASGGLIFVSNTSVATFSGAVQNNSGASFQVQDSSGDGFSTSATLAAGLTNAGMVTLNGNNNDNVSLLVTGALTNTGSILINSTGGTSGSRTLQGQLLNSGSVAVNLSNNRVAYFNLTGDSTNTGGAYFTIAAGQALIGGGYKLTNTGEISVAAGAELKVASGSTLVHSVGATLIGSGTTIIDGGATLRLESDLSTDIGSCLTLGYGGLTAAIVTKSASEFIDNYGTLNIGSATVAPNIFNENSGYIYVTDAYTGVTLSGALNNLSGSHLVVSDVVNATGGTNLTVGGLLTNSGTIELSLNNSDDVVTLDVTGAGLVNNSTGVITISNTGGTTFGVSVLGQLTNSGSITINLTNSRLAGFVIGTHDSTNETGATFTVTAGTAVIYGSGSKFTNRGTVTISSGAVLKIDGTATLVQDNGGFSGSGTLLVNDGASLFTNSNFVVASGMKVQLGATSTGAAANFGKLSGSNTVINQGTITALKSTIDPNIWNYAGTVQVKDSNGAVTFAGTFVNESGSTLLVADTVDGVATKAYLTGGISNSGTITINSTNSNDSVTLDTVGGTITNYSTGLIQFTNAGGGTTFSHFLYAGLSNSGTVTVNLSSSRTATIDIGATSSTNASGAHFNVLAGNAIVTSLGGSFSNSGDINVASGASLKFSGSTTVFAQSGGTYSGTGTTIFGDGTTLHVASSLTIASGATWQVGTTAGAGATITKPGAQTVTNNGTLELNNSNVLTSIINADTIKVFESNGLVSITGNITNQISGTILINDSIDNASNTRLSVSGNLTNSGSVYVTGTTNDSATLDMTGAIFSNTSTGTLNFTNSGGGTTFSRGFSGQMLNSGTITVNLTNSRTATLNFGSIVATNDAGASFNVTAGTAVVTGSGTWTNAGTISVASGAVLKISGTETLLHGSGATLSGAGGISFEDGTTLSLSSNLTIGSGLKLSFGTVAGAGANITRSTTEAITNAGTLDLKRSTVAPPITNQSGGVLKVADSYAPILSNALTNQVGGSVLITDTVDNGVDTVLTLTSTLSNTGFITLSSVNSNDAVTLDMGLGGFLTNSASGSITFMSSGSTSAIQRFYGSLTNSGTITVSLASTETATLNIGNSNSGENAGSQFNVTGGTAIVTGTGVSFFTTQATHVISSGATLKFDGGSTVSHGSGGTFTGTGTLWIDGGTTFILGAYAATITPTLHIGGGGIVHAYGVNDDITLAGTVNIDYGGLLELKDQNNADTDTEFNITGVVNNSGTVTLTVPTGGITDGVKLDMAGSTFNNLSGGLLRFYSGSGSAGVFAFAGGLNNSGQVTLDDNATFTIGASNINNLSGGVFTIGAGQTATLTAGGAGQFQVQSGATLNVTGTLNLNGHDLFNAGTINNFANINFGGGVYIIGGSQSVAGTSIASGATIALGSGGTFTGSGTLTIQDGGTLKVYGNGTIASGLTVAFGTGASGATWNNIGGAVATIAGVANLYSGTVSSNLSVANAGQILFQNTTLATVSGAVTVLTGGTVLINDTVGNNTIANFTGAVSNSGTVTLDRTGGSSGNTQISVSGSGTFTNLSGGIFHVSAGNGYGTRTMGIGGGGFTNNTGGTIDIDWDTSFTGGGSLSNGGVLDIAAGKTLSITTNSIFAHAAGGSYTGTGTLFIDDGSTIRFDAAGTVASGFTILFGTTAGTGATWSSTGGAVASIAGLANLKRGTVSGNITAANGGQILVQDSNNLVTLSGITTVQTGGTLRVNDTSGSTTAVTVTGTLNNAGTITLDRTGGSAGDTQLAFSSAGVLNNNTGGTLHVTAGNGYGTRSVQIGSTALNNAGGTIDIDRDTTVYGGTLRNAGLIDIASGTTLSVASTLVSDAGATYASSGTLFIQDLATLRFDAPGTITSGLTVLFGSTGGSGATWSNTGGAIANIAGLANLKRVAVSADVTVINGGQILVQDSNALVTLSGTTNIQNGGLLLVNDTSGSTTSVNVTGTMNSDGIIRLDRTGGSSGDTKLNLTGGTLNITAAGTLLVSSGNGYGTRTLQIGANALTNAGTIDVDWDFSVYGGTLNKGGVLDIATSHTMTITSGATLVHTGGTYTGGGTLFIADGATYRFDSAGTIASGLTMLLGTTSGSGATWSNTGGAVASVAGLANLKRGTVSAAVSIANGGQVLVQDSNALVTLSGTTNVQTGGVLLINATDGGYTKLYVTGTLNNSGIVRLDHTGGSTGDPSLDLTGGTFTNLAGGTLHFSAGNGYNIRVLQIGANAFTNNGTIDVDWQTSVNGGTLINAGNIDIASAQDLHFNGGTTLVNATGGTYTAGNNGTLTIESGATFRFDADGTIASPLTVFFGNTGGAAATWSNTNNATATIAGVVYSKKGTISANLSIASGGIFYNDTADLVTLSGAVSVLSGGTIQVYTDGGATNELNVTSTLTNSGTVRLTNLTGSSGGPVLDLTGGLLANQTTGILDIAGGNGYGARTVKGAITNAGAINVHWDATFTPGASNIENLSGGSFTIDSGKTATLTAGGAGIFMVDIGSTLTVNGALNLNGHDLYGGGTIVGLGNITFGGGTYILGGSQSLGGQTISSGQTLAFGAGTFSGPGTLTIADGGTLKTYGAGTIASDLTVLLGTTGNTTATWSNVGGASAIIEGILVLQGGVVSSNLTVAYGGLVHAANTNDYATLSGIVDIQSGATLQVTDTINNSTVTELNVTGTVNNAGLILVDGAAVELATLDATSGTINNNAGGVIRTAGNTTRVLKGNFNNNVGGTLEINVGTNITGSGLNNYGTVDIAAGTSLTVTSGAALGIQAGSAFGGHSASTSVLFLADNAQIVGLGNATFSSGLKVLFGTTGGVGPSWTNLNSAVMTFAGYAELHSGNAALLSVANGGLITAMDTGTSSLTVDSVTVQSGGTLQAKDVINNSTVTKLNVTTISNAGLVEVTTASAEASTLNVLGTFSNLSNGTFRTTNTASGAVNFGGTLNNAGWIEINASASYLNGTITNNGAFGFANGATLALNAGATLANGNAGIHFTGTGTLFVQDLSTFRVDANVILDSTVALQLGTTGGSGGTWSNTGGATATVAGAIDLRTGTVSTNLTVASGATVTANDTGVTGLSMSGHVIVNSGGTLQVNDLINNSVTSHINATGTIDNSGLVIVTSSSAESSYLHLTGGGVVNTLSGGILRVTATGAGSRFFDGTVNIASGGAVEINASGTYTSGTMTNAGAFSIANLATFAVSSGATLVHNGAATGYTGSGWINLADGAVFRFDTSGAIGAGVVVLLGTTGGAGATWSHTGGAVVTIAGEAELRAGTVSTDLDISVGTVTAVDTGTTGLTISGHMTVESAGVFRVRDNINNSMVSRANVTGIIDNSGLVSVTGAAVEDSYLMMSGGGALNILSGGILRVANEAAGQRYLGGTISNASGGTIDVTYSGTFLNGTITNAGYFAFSNAAVFTVASGATLVHNGVSTSYAGSGFLDIADGATFRFDTNGMIGVGVTVRLGTSAGSGATWSNTGGAVATIAGTATLRKGTVSGALSVASGGLVSVEDTSNSPGMSLTGSIAVLSGGTLQLRDTVNNSQTSRLNVTGSITNAGLVKITSATSESAVLDVTGGSFSNLSGGILRFADESGAASRILLGTVSNAAGGTIDVTYDGYFQGSGTLTNSGAVAVGSGMAFTIDTGTTLVNAANTSSYTGAGKINIASGATLQVEANMTVGSGLTILLGSSTGLATVTKVNTPVITVLGTMDLRKVSIAPDITVSSGGVMKVSETNGLATLSGVITVQTGGTVGIGDTVNNSITSVLTITGTLNNSGSVYVTGVAGVEGSGLDISGGTFNNLTGGQFIIEQGTSGGGTRAVSGGIANAGAVTVSYGAVSWTLGSAHIDVLSGGSFTINVGDTLTLGAGGTGMFKVESGGTLTVNGVLDMNGHDFYDAGGTIVNGDNIVLGSGYHIYTGVLDVTGRTVDPGERVALAAGISLTGSGTVVIDSGGTLRLDTNVTGPSGMLLQLGQFGGTAFLTGTGNTLTVYGGMDLRQGTIGVNITNMSGSTIQVRTNTGNFINATGSTIDNQSGATISIEGSGTPGDAWFSGGFVLNNSGTVTLTNGYSGGSRNAQLGNLTSVTNNLAGGVLSSDVGAFAGANRQISGELNNAGTVNLNRATNFNINTSASDNLAGGQFNVISGATVITGASGGTFSNAGVLAITAGASLTITGGVALTQVSGGTYTGNSSSRLVINTGASFNLNAAATLNPQIQLGQYGGSASITGSGQTLTLNGWMDARQGTVSANIVNASGSTIEVRTSTGQSVAFTGTVTNNSGATVLVEGSTNGDATMSGAFHLVNSGTITLTNSNAGASQGAFLGGSGAVIDNVSGGTVNINVGSNATAGGRTIQASFNNYGTTNINADTTFQGGGTFSNIGTLSIASSKTLTISAGILSATTGSVFSGAGSIAIGSGSAFGIYADTTLANKLIFGVYGQTGASTFGSGILTLSNGMEARKGTFNNDVINTSGSTIRVTTATGESADFAGAITNQSGGTVQVEASTAGTAWMGGAFTLTNSGTVLLTSTYANPVTASLGSAGAILINQSSGVVNIIDGANAYGRTLTADISNSGTINSGATGVGINIGTTDSDNLSGAQFNVTAGDTTITGSGTPKFNNAGVINVASGATLKISGTTALTQLSGGTYTGAGSLIIDAGASFALTAAASVSQKLQLGQYSTATDATLSGSGQTLTLSGGLDARKSVIGVNIVNASGSTFQVTGTTGQSVSAAGITITNQTGGVLVVKGTSSGDTALLTGAFTLNNSGAASVTSTYANPTNAALGSAGAVINNLSGGVFTISQGSGSGTRTVNGEVHNTGTINLSADDSIWNIGSVNSDNYSGGQINAQSGNGWFIGSSGGVLRNAGAISVSSGAVFVIAGGADLKHLSAGTYTGLGVLDIGSGSTFTLTANASIAPVLRLGQWGGAAAAIIDSGGTLTLNGGMDARRGTVAPSIINSGGSTIAVNTANGESVTFSGATVTNANGAVIVVQASTSGDATLNVSGSFLNSGLVSLTSNYANPVYATLNASGGFSNLSTGNLQLSDGSNTYTRTLAGGLTNSGVVSSGATDAAFNIGSANITNNTGASFNVASGTATVSGTGGFYNTGAITVSTGATLKIGSGVTLYHQSGGSYTGSGTILIDSGGTLNVSAASLALAAKLQLGTAAGAASITGSGQTLTLNGGMDAWRGTIAANVDNNAGSTLAVKGSGNAVTFNGNLVNYGSGTFNVQAGSSGAALAVLTQGITNYGTVNVTSSGASAAATLNATGQVVFNSGALNINVGGGGARTVNGTLSNDGTIAVATNATFNVGTGGGYNSGFINVTAGTMTLSGSSATFGTESTITVSGGATFSIGSGVTVYHVAGASYGGGGTVSVASGGAFNVATNVAMADTFTIAGTVTVSDCTFQVTGTNTISASGILRIEDQASATDTIYASTVPMTNNGTILLTSSGSGGATKSILYAHNHLVTNASGGVFQSDVGVGGGRQFFGDLTNAAGGTITINTSTNFYLTNYDLDNTGTINITAGTVNLDKGLQSHAGGQIIVASGANLVMNGNSVTNDSGATMTINGELWLGDGPGGTSIGGLLSTLDNGGTINGNGDIHLEGGTYNILGGGTTTITPGLSPGHLTIDGNVNYNSAVLTVIELGGAAHDQYDLLTVTGHFGLAGNLSVVDYHGFAAQAGDSFQVLEFGDRTGMFDQMTGLDGFGAVALDPIFSDTGLTLIARTITAEGTEGGDVLTGTSAGDVLVGRGGDDTLIGGAGDDLLLGGEGSNTLNGGAGDDRLIGGTGTDTVDYSTDPAGVTVDLSKGFALDGWGGHDTIISAENVAGSAFADTIIGNAKDNVLAGNGGADTLTGGAGADTFVLGSPNAIASTITDFVSGQDKIQVDLTGFNFGATVQSGANFSVIAAKFDGSLAGANAAFADGHASLIYSEFDNTLYFDANGAQEGYSVVAHLQAGAHLVASDIRVVDHLMA